MKHQGVFAHWPNRITAMRFGGALVLFVIFALWGEVSVDEMRQHPVLAQILFWLFVGGALSDTLDGMLARRLGQTSTFGRIADPFVDKAMVMGTMTFLAAMPWSQEFFPAWVVVLVLSREFLVTGLRGYLESQGHEFPADWFGKVKMVAQCVAVSAVLGLYAFHFPSWWTSVIHALVSVTIVATIGSGFSYMLKAVRLLR